MSNIAIIGAGIAGLTALQSLKEAGHSVTVFDKSRGSGGRLSSKKTGESSWDMGAQYLRAHTPEFQQTLEQWEANGWVAEWSLTPWSIDGESRTASADDVKRYVGMPRMTGLSRQLLAAADDFITSTRITEVLFDGEWILISEEGDRFGPFSEIVLNMPPEQARDLIPETSSLHGAVDDLPMNPCWTLLLGFDQALDTPMDGAFVKSGPLAWIARNNSKPGRDPREAWVIQASHDWSQAHVDAPREQVIEQLSAAFAKALGLALPPAADVWVHRWLFSVPAKAPKLGALRDETHNLTVCGDWCERPSVEGAWISGQHAARLLAGDNYE